MRAAREALRRSPTKMARPSCPARHSCWVTTRRFARSCPARSCGAGWRVQALRHLLWGHQRDQCGHALEGAERKPLITQDTVLLSDFSARHIVSIAGRRIEGIPGIPKALLEEPKTECGGKLDRAAPPAVLSDEALTGVADAFRVGGAYPFQPVPATCRETASGRDEASKA